MTKIENISYGYKPKQPIFSDISLKVGSGIYGLLGENGVGKTTLIHLICGLLFPWKGECSIDNSNSARRSPELLNRSLDEISERLLFARTAYLPEDSLYSEQDLHGYFSILPNEEGEENTPDIELLYKAVLQVPEKIKMIWNE